MPTNFLKVDKQANIVTSQFSSNTIRWTLTHYLCELFVTNFLIKIMWHLFINGLLYAKKKSHDFLIIKIVYCHIICINDV